jgi:hypothetical protein
LLDHLEPDADCLAQWRITLFRERRRVERTGSGEGGNDLHWAEGNDAHFNALHGEGVGCQLIAKCLQPFIQFLERSAAHRHGDIEQKKAWNAGLRIGGEVRDLFEKNLFVVQFWLPKAVEEPATKIR